MHSSLVALWAAAVTLTLAIGCGPQDRAPFDAPDAQSAPPTTPRGFTRNEVGAFVASHPAPGFSSTIDGHGAQLVGPNATWSMSLHVTRLGRLGAMRELQAGPVAAASDRVRLLRGDGITEWFEHRERGLEHGVDVARRPPGEGRLVIEIATDGRTPVVAADGTSAELRDGEGAAPLTYGELVVKDAAGRLLPARMMLDAGALALQVEDAGATYPIEIDPLVWGTQQAKLTASDAATFSSFGSSVVIDGNTVVVGAPLVNTAYVFVRSGTTWTEQAKLQTSDCIGSSICDFGRTLALDGDTVVVGAPHAGTSFPGAGYVFVRSGTTWTQQAKLVADDDTKGNQFATGLAISGDTVIAGAPQNTIGANTWQGAAYLYVRSGTAWTQQAKVVASDGAAFDNFGAGAALTGSTAVVGAPGRSTGGVAYAFTRSGTTWTQQATLVASDGAPTDMFGDRIAISGTTVLLGAWGASAYKGAGYVFVQSGTTWSQQAKLVASDGVADDRFGRQVALSGASALLGADLKDVGAHADQGAAYAFVRSGTAWTQQALLVASDGVANDNLVAVAVSGSTAIAGTSRAASVTGAAYVFIQLAGNGDVCTTTTQCLSGFCVDGVCCDAACGGLCQACSAAKKGVGLDGVCSPIKAGVDLEGECPTTCTGSSLSTTNGCGGATTACAAPTVTSCAPYACGIAACKTTCAVDGDCASTAYCKGTTCVPKLANGVLCTAPGQCTAGFCADGVCCNAACSGVCQSCVLSATGSADGTCAAVKDGVDPRGVCTGATCSGDTLTNSVCDGSAKCRPNTKDCSPAKCVASGAAATCATACTADGDCGASGYCKGTACAPRGERGATCAAGNECKTSFCADGVCCDGKCDGQCQACAEPGSAGTCVASKGKPKGTRPDCAGAGSACYGQCDGSNSASCAYPTTSASCGDGCKDGKVSTCDGAGVCLAPAACAGSLGCADGSKCRSTCVTDADCVSGFACSGGKCTLQRASCSTDKSSSVSPDRSTTKPCLPFVCNSTTGDCYAECATTEQCSVGYSCDGRSCVPAAGAGAAGDEGGGCAYAGSGAGSALGAVVTMALGCSLLARRRRVRIVASAARTHRR